MEHSTGSDFDGGRGDSQVTISEDRHRERLAFLRIDDTVQRGMAIAQRSIKPVLPEIIAEFYKHLRRWPRMKAMFRSDDHMDEIAVRQQKHWALMLGSSFDQEYAQRVKNVGYVHSRIGLEPHWYIGGYEILFEGMLLHLVENLLSDSGKHKGFTHRFRSDVVNELKDAIVAITRGAFLDIEYTIDVYYTHQDKLVAERRQAIRKVAHDFSRRIEGTLQPIHPAGDKLEATSQEMLDYSNRASRAADSLDENTRETLQSTDRVQSQVETLSESLTAFRDEVRQNRTTADKSVERAGTATIELHELTDTVHRVNQVVDLIKNIADQTNLLSINAMIEASRAGAAGKGFSVVAGEVKSLSSQTAEATNRIATEVANMERVAGRAADSITRIVEEIRTMGERIGKIEERLAVASESAADVTLKLRESADRTRDVYAEVQEVSKLAGLVETAGKQVRDCVTELRRRIVDAETDIGSFSESILED